MEICPTFDETIIHDYFSDSPNAALITSASFSCLTLCCRKKDIQKENNPATKRIMESANEQNDG
jgi:hypothetical protein